MVCMMVIEGLVSFVVDEEPSQGISVANLLRPLSDGETSSGSCQL